ncbi:YsnF/AvaK domain-containing protein [Ramlibacter sp. AN1015]|uniref:YsnF/AvaK domain-containing protein n=1 Tax=Ramlibacter sp. AN1015 TaxID=3133428 RepID=UPI0030BC3ABE
MHTVIGAFDDKTTAQRAVDRLLDAGFDRKDVHLEHKDASSTTATSGSTDTRHEGGSGGISGFFQSLFGTDDSSERYGDTYDEAVRRGSYVVVVDARSDSEADRASTLLDDLGAFDIDERANQWRSSGWTGGTTGTTGSTGMTGTTGAAAGTRGTTTGTAGTTNTQLKAGQEGVANVVQEELQVGKRSVNRGGVRVIQRVSERPVHEVVRLREEHATVNRQKVDRPANEGDLQNFREGTIEVRETSEQPVVSKQARVVEEVRVGKEVREREHTVDDKVRRKDVDVERIDGTRESAAASDRTLGKTDKPTR